MADEDLSYLSFLDDSQSDKGSDLSYLSFLNEPEVSDRTASQGFQGSGRYPEDLAGPQRPTPKPRTIADSFQGSAPFPEQLAGPQKPKPVPEPTGPIQDYPRPLKKRNLDELMAEAQELNQERLTSDRSATKLGSKLMDYIKTMHEANLDIKKGALSGATLTASQRIDPFFKPKEDDILYALGETIGTALPASIFGYMYGMPLMKMAIKAPKYANALMSLASMTGMGLTGASIKASRDIVQGEIPDPKEVAKEGALWFALDGALQFLGLANQFRQSINRIAEKDGISRKEVLGQLWNATKNFVKQKYNRAIGKPETIRPDDIEIMAQIADQRAAGVGETIDISPKQIGMKPGKAKRQPRTPKETATPDIIEAGAPKPTRQIELMPEKPKRQPRPAKVTETPGIIEGQAPAKKPKVEAPIPKETPVSTPPIAEEAKPAPKTKPKGKPKPESEIPFLYKKGESIPLEKIPDKIYHVTTNRPAIEQSGLIKKGGKDKGGLGGVHDVVSFTADKDIANQILDDIIFANNYYKNFKGEGTKYLKYPELRKPESDKKANSLLKVRAEIDGFEYEPLQDLMSPREHLDWYYKLRERETGKPNPVFQNIIDVNVDDIGIIEVEKGNLPDKAKAGTDTHLKEIAFDEDIKLSKPEPKPEPKEEPKPIAEAKPEKKPKEKPKPAKATKPKAKKPASDTLASQQRPRQRQPIMGKGQTIAKQKMIQRMREIFKDPIRIGKIRQRPGGKTLGIHKLWPKISRILHHNDVETAAHEIGHNLHGILYGGNARTKQEFFDAAMNALAPYLGELKPLAGYEPYQLEGFAEFVRMYVTNPATVKAMAPNFYSHFETLMQAQEPQLLEGLLELRGYYEDWLQAAPEERVKAQIDFDKETITKRVKLLYNTGISEYVDKAVQLWIDEYRPAQRVEALIYDLPIHEIEEMSKPSLYRALRLLKNSPLNIEQYLYHGTFDPITKETTGESLSEILKEIRTDEDWKDFNAYLTSQRALELMDRNIEKGIRPGDAQATIKKYAHFDKTAKRFRAWIDRTLDYAIKSELISADDAAKMRDAGLFYVPLQVERPQKERFAGLKRLQAKSPFKRIKGSTSRIVPPVEGAIKNLYQIITNADKNRVGLVLAKLAKEKGAGQYVERLDKPMKLVGLVKTPEIEAAVIKHLVETGNTDYLIKVGKKWKLSPEFAELLPESILRFRPGSYRNEKNIVTVYEKGKQVQYEVAPELYDMWAGVIDPQSMGFILKAVGLPTKLKRMSATLNIPFAVNNLIRDSWERLMYSRFPPNPKDIKDVAEHIFLPIRMLAEVAGHGDLYNLYIRSGGGLSTLVSLDKASLQTTALQVRKGKRFAWRKLFSPKYVAHLVRRVVEIGEEANKLAEFYRGIKEYGDTVLGREMAAFAARDLSIDHNRAGLAGRAMNQVTAFFNAGMQGGNKFYRRLRDPRARRNTLLGMFAFVSLPSALAYLTVYDDEDYKELSDAEKDRNLIFKAYGQFYKIPVPFEPGIIANGAVRRFLDYVRVHDVEAFKGFAHSLFEGMLPPIVPDVAHAPLEIAANRDFFRDAPIIPKAKEGLIAREQYKEYTSLTARLLGRWISYLPGVDPTSKVSSPAMIDHLILAYATRWGQLGLGILDKAIEPTGLVEASPRPSRPILDQLGFNLFKIRYPRANTQSIQEFYEQYAEIKALQKTKKFYEGVDRYDDADEMRAILDDKGNPKRFDLAYKALQRVQAMINRTFTDTRISDEQRQKLIDDMYLQKTAIARDQVQEMKDWQKKQREKEKEKKKAD